MAARRNEVGVRVAKEFPGYGVCMGKCTGVVLTKKGKLFKVIYDDRDYEEMYEAEYRCACRLAQSVEPSSAADASVSEVSPGFVPST